MIRLLIVLVGAFSAYWSHQGRDMIESIDRRLLAVEKVLMIRGAR